MRAARPPYNLAQHLGRVLAEVGRGPRERDRRAREARERARGAQLAAVGELHRPPEVAHREVLEREHVGDRVHGRERDAARDAAREELGLACACA